MKKTHLVFKDKEVIFDISNLNLKPKGTKTILDDEICYEFKIVDSKSSIVFCLSDINSVQAKFRENSSSILEWFKKDQKERIEDDVFFEVIDKQTYSHTRIDNWDGSSKIVLFVKKISDSIFILIKVGSMEYDYQKLIDIGTKLIETLEINTIV